MKISSLKFAAGIVALILLTGGVYAWFAPKKIQDIVPINEEAVVFNFDGSWQRRETLDKNFTEELNDLWCIKLHDASPRYYSGEFKLLYENSCEVRITPGIGYIYSSKANYYFVNGERVKEIWNELSKKEDIKQAAF